MQFCLYLPLSAGPSLKARRARPSAQTDDPLCQVVKPGSGVPISTKNAETALGLQKRGRLCAKLRALCVCCIDAVAIRERVQRGEHVAGPAVALKRRREPRGRGPEGEIKRQKKHKLYIYIYIYGYSFCGCEDQLTSPGCARSPDTVASPAANLAMTALAARARARINTGQDG